MLGNSALMAFVATANPDEARAFYRDILGLRLVDEHDFALVFDSSGTTLRIQKVESVAPVPYTALGWRVDDIHASVHDLVERGVTFERFPGISQDNDAVWSNPFGVGVAWFKDPDGNLLSLSEGLEARG
ncbi:MAG TPA: VOC family protein [Chloroflexota bacterium]|jgi:catechol 2,3-dioxygenase-like lactoylglutathione lyase family enzyme|nr:VOC family protein [Chloroflexota bacterium]